MVTVTCTRRYWNEALSKYIVIVTGPHWWEGGQGFSRRSWQPWVPRTCRTSWTTRLWNGGRAWSKGSQRCSWSPWTTWKSRLVSFLSSPVFLWSGLMVPRDSEAPSRPVDMYVRNLLLISRICQLTDTGNEHVGYARENPFVSLLLSNSAQISWDRLYPLLT